MAPWPVPVVHVRRVRPGRTGHVTSLQHLEALARRHERAAQRLAAHRQARDEAMVDLLDAGHTTDEVAAYAHLTQPRVVQIAKAVRASRPSTP